jgi:hypothetical protein
MEMVKRSIRSKKTFSHIASTPREVGGRLCDYSFWREAAFRLWTLNPLPFLTYACTPKETTNMGTKSIIGTWVGILALIAIMLGGLEHASMTDPAGVETARVAVRGIVIPPFN